MMYKSIIKTVCVAGIATALLNTAAMAQEVKWQTWQEQATKNKFGEVDGRYYMQASMAEVKNDHPNVRSSQWALMIVDRGDNKVGLTVAPSPSYLGLVEIMPVIISLKNQNGNVQEFEGHTAPNSSSSSNLTIVCASMDLAKALDVNTKYKIVLEGVSAVGDNWSARADIVGNSPGAKMRAQLENKMKIEKEKEAEVKRVQDSIASEAQRKEAERINKLKSYKYTGRTVIIGKQMWMAENLNNEYGGVCYDDNPSNCATYGRLYSRDEAMAACPVGFHLPSEKEWDELKDYVDCKSCTGERLKSKTGWKENEYYKGTDQYGFSALPGGYSGSGGSFTDVGSNGYWWTADKYDVYMEYNSNGMGRRTSYSNHLLSVRCVRDLTEAEAKEESQRIAKAQELARTESVIRNKFMALFDMDKMNNAYNEALKKNKKFEGYVTVSFIIKNKGVATYDVDRSLRSGMAARDVTGRDAWNFFIQHGAKNGWERYNGILSPYFGEGPCTKVDFSFRFGKKDKKSKNGEVNISIDKVQSIDGKICDITELEKSVVQELERTK